VLFPFGSLGQPIAAPTWSYELEMGAKNGRTRSQLDLADVYNSGRGIKQDFSEAAKWYQKVAETKLGSNEAAQKWYLKAAEQGHLKAIDAVRGRTPEDSYFWCMISSKYHPQESYRHYVCEAAYGLWPEQEAIINKRVADWNPTISKAVADQGSIEANAEAGDAQAEFLLGQRLEIPDLDGLQLDVSIASRELGKLYEKGLGVPQDYKKAADLYLKAIHTSEMVGDEPKYLLANLYEHGLGVTQNYDEAITLYKEGAASCSYAASYPATNGLGRLYLNGGPNIPPNYQEAYFWLQHSRKVGIFSKGKFIPRDEPDLQALIDETAGHLTPQQIAELDKRQLPKGKYRCANVLP
jgi:TPR repeat protein